MGGFIMEPNWISNIRQAKEKTEGFIFCMKYYKSVMAELANKDRTPEEEYKYNKYKDVDYDSKISNAEKKLTELEVKLKKALASYKKWQIEHDFKE